MASAWRAKPGFEKEAGLAASPWLDMQKPGFTQGAEMDARL
jgi:hypothetical protein